MRAAIHKGKYYETQDNFEMRILLMRFLPTALLPVLALVLSSSIAAHANMISGTVYCGVSTTDASNTPAPGAAISGSVCATFQTSTINFLAAANTIGGFLSSNSSTAGSVAYMNGYTSASNLDFSVFQFTGTGYFVSGQTYSATHDDGTVMNVNGVTVINAPAPTSARVDSFTFTGTTGNYGYQYDYSEVQGASTYVTNAANSPVPEPSSLMLMGTGILGAAGAVRRRMGRV